VPPKYVNIVDILVKADSLLSIVLKTIVLVAVAASFNLKRCSYKVGLLIKSDQLPVSAALDTFVPPDDVAVLFL
jgi:hypothetical protein